MNLDIITVSVIIQYGPQSLIVISFKKLSKNSTSAFLLLLSLDSTSVYIIRSYSMSYLEKSKSGKHKVE